MIDLQKLNYEDEIQIDEIINIPKNYLDDSEIKELDSVKVSGKITKDYDENYVLDLKINSKMILLDAITLDEIPYEFSVDIQETLEKNIKTLDLIPFLWHYIMLEVPLRITKNEEKYPTGDNFRVISEEEYTKMNNPFKDFHLE